MAFSARYHLTCEFQGPILESSKSDSAALFNLNLLCSLIRIFYSVWYRPLISPPQALITFLAVSSLMPICLEKKISFPQTRSNIQMLPVCIHHREFLLWRVFHINLAFIYYLYFYSVLYNFFPLNFHLPLILPFFIF